MLKPSKVKELDSVIAKLESDLKEKTIFTYRGNSYEVKNSKIIIGRTSLAIFTKTKTLVLKLDQLSDVKILHDTYYKNRASKEIIFKPKPRRMSPKVNPNVEREKNIRKLAEQINFMQKVIGNPYNLKNPWTIEEDRVILQHKSLEASTKISRTLADINKRKLNLTRAGVTSIESLNRLYKVST
jgi:hypothetical protein